MDISPLRLLRLPEVLNRVPVSKSTWWAGVGLGFYASNGRVCEICGHWGYLRLFIVNLPHNIPLKRGYVQRFRERMRECQP